MMVRKTHLLMLSLLACARLVADDTQVSAKADEQSRMEFFEKKIRPVLVSSCYECHSVQSGKSKGGLLLDSREALLKGGNTGPAVVPGDPTKSLLIKAIRYGDDELEMPPKTRLPEIQVADMEEWIRQGAFDPRKAAVPLTSYKVDMEEAKKFWSFQPVHKPVVPDVQNAQAAPTPIDRFLQAKREEQGLPVSPPADKVTLLRRVTYDLTGLPPTPEELDAFIKDESPSAFSKQVDRLLASPAYGERWGRHWLDVAHYSDTAGDSADYPVVEAYKYRDWVIRAFNEDKPYDQFVREQLAGDLMQSENEKQRCDRIVATGYIALARRFAVNPEKLMHLTIEDTLDTVGRSLFGLSISCARCHDHKFDPIPTSDYYSLYGFFSSSRFPFAGSEENRRPHDLVPLLPQAEAQTRIAAISQKLKDLDEAFKSAERERKKFEKSPGEGLTPEQQKNRLNELRKLENEARKAHTDYFRESWNSWDKAFAMADEKGEDAKIQRRGEPSQPGEVAPRKNLTIFGGQTLPAGTTGSGRLQLAQWLTDASNPLLARVMANRIWQHHFGQGIVQTPNDFGKQGKPPSHPELLDYLAARFFENGYSVKALHREILATAAYQMANASNEAASEKDPGDVYLWRAPRLRLDAEELRDAMLAVSGSLDTTPGKEHPFPPINTWNFTQHDQFFGNYDHNKRSVYLMVQRLRRHPYLSLFDGADPSFSTGARSETTTPLQALFMMNSQFVHDRASAFAKRLSSSAADMTARITLAYRLAYGRLPSPEELTACTEFLGKVEAAVRKVEKDEKKIEPMVWASFARTVLSSNEFLYLE
jgi:hypothetical protein